MPTAADLELTSALRIAVMRLARRLRGQRTDESFSASQLSALATLEHHGPLTLGELASREKVQPPSMTRIVGCLEGHDLVARTPDPDDRRQVFIDINDGGRALLRADRRRRDAWLAERLVDLSDDEREALRLALPLIERLATA